MITFFIVLLLMVLITISIKGFRNTEFVFLLPFLMGAGYYLFSGSVHLYDQAYVFLGGCILFEWTLLLFSSLAVNSMFGHYEFLERKYIFRVSRLGLAVIIGIVVGYLSYYVASKLIVLSDFKTFNDYFLHERANAHTGNGVHITNWLAYRLVNYSMVLVIILYALGFLYRKDLLARVAFIMIFFVAGLASLMEGNRSTLIVPVLCLLCLEFFYRKNLYKAFIGFLFFVCFFIFSQIMLRIGGGFDIDVLLMSLNWFFLYSFGSISSFSSWFNLDIDLYWKSYDVLVEKFSIPLPYKDFFIIESVDAGGRNTNVYTGYAVLFDYMNWYFILFICVKVFIYRFVQIIMSHDPVLRVGCIFLTVSFPLTIYHEYFITCLYYLMNFIIVYLCIRVSGVYRGVV